MGLYESGRHCDIVEGDIVQTYRKKTTSSYELFARVSVLCHHAILICSNCTQAFSPRDQGVTSAHHQPVLAQSMSVAP